MYSLISVLFLSGCVLINVISIDVISIPGCPDINSLSETTSELSGEKLDRIKCVCASDIGGKGIEVNCVFGSSFDDLAQVLDEIDKLNQTARQITLNHVTVSNKITLTEVLNRGSIEQLEIKNCHGGPLEVSDAINESLALNELTQLTIENCELKEIPTAIINRTTQLRSISLSNNKIEFIGLDQLKGVSNSLEYLDLTENLINGAEEGSLQQLNKLHTILIGEHNFANSSLINEVAQIKKLKILDLTRIDGINNVDQLEFQEGNQMERLVLTGCNLKVINASSFSTLTQLKELDMRVNLIEKLEADSFLGLESLERMSLAGNFLRESELREECWIGLKNLTQLDLGWNEFKTMHNNSFGSTIGETLQILSLRSNEKLKTIEDDAFFGLNILQNLNMSGSSLERLDGNAFNGLNSLETLDLSNNNLSFIGTQAFEPVKKSLTTLNLSNNKLRNVDIDVLSGLNLTEIDLSGNDWLCDKNILKLADWVRNQYSNAAKSSSTFVLSNAAKTVCDRPYTKQGSNIMDLTMNDVEEYYNEKMDTTTKETMTENITEPAVQESTQLFDLSKLVAEIGTTNDTLDINVDEGKPTYDINLIKYGKQSVKDSGNTWISVVILMTLLIITTIGVAIVIRKRAKSNRVTPSNTQEASSTL